MSDILNMKSITKEFGSFKANDDICIDVHQGEILALLGENGAGKSTLMNILYGLYKPTSGDIFFQGKKVEIENPLKAIEMGIGMVHQHFMLIQAFKTWENVVLGLKDEQKKVLKEDIARKKINELAKKYDLTVYPDALIDTLSVGLQQQVEIVKVLYRGAKLLILDEPTAVLTPNEIVELFRTLRNLANGGVSIIFISHKLDEVMEISDRVSVLCRGKNIATVNTKDVTKTELARLMVGRNVVLTVEHDSSNVQEDVVLKIEDLFVEGNRLASCIKGLNLAVHKGEILGVAGVDGNGQSELVESITGLRKVTSGKISVNNKDLTNCKVSEDINSGMALIPEDRNKVGTVRSFTIDRNMILRNAGNSKYTRNGIIDYESLRKDTDEVIKEFDIRLSDRNETVNKLSGGNLQKVILAREIKSNPTLLLAMHPTRGLDVGAIEFIHQKLIDACKAGAAVLLVSTELEEIVSLSDSVVIMNNGNISKVLKEKDLTIENIGLLMGGSTIEESADEKIE